jgi:hypothetical protein
LPLTRRPCARNILHVERARELEIFARRSRFTLREILSSVFIQLFEVYVLEKLLFPKVPWIHRYMNQVSVSLRKGTHSNIRLPDDRHRLFLPRQGKEDSLRVRWARSDGRGRGEEVCAGGFGVYTGPQKADAGAVHPAPKPDRGALRCTAATRAPRGES